MNWLLIIGVLLLIAAIGGGYYYWSNSIEQKFPHWGWGDHEGLRCRNNDNTGCDTHYNENGELVPN